MHAHPVRRGRRGHGEHGDGEDLRDRVQAFRAGPDAQSWGRRRLAYEIGHANEGTDVVDLRWIQPRSPSRSSARTSRTSRSATRRSGPSAEKKKEQATSASAVDEETLMGNLGWPRQPGDALGNRRRPRASLHAKRHGGVQVPNRRTVDARTPAAVEGRHVVLLINACRRTPAENARGSRPLQQHARLSRQPVPPTELENQDGDKRSSIEVEAD